MVWNSSGALSDELSAAVLSARNNGALIKPEQNTSFRIN